MHDKQQQVLFAIALSAAKHTQTVERAQLADNCSRGSGSEDSSLSSSEEAPSPAPLGAAASVVGSTSETEDEDEMMRHSPERMMALSINHHQIYPKLHQMVDRIVADLERLKSKNAFHIAFLYQMN